MPPSPSVEHAHRWEETWRALADHQLPRTPWARVAQGALAFASLAYRAGHETHRAAYRWGVLITRRAPVPVVCIGNLTLGGTGKTPVVEWLARAMRTRGQRPAILTRGYGGHGAQDAHAQAAAMVADGRNILMKASEAGDEPLELAHALTPIGVAVVRGASRHEAAQLACSRLDPTILILDDGFQHYALARNRNIIVVDATQPLDRLRLFPRGSLREGMQALERAHAVVLTRCDLAGDQETKRIEQILRARFPRLLLVPTRMAFRGLADPETGELRAPIASLRGHGAVGFCAVGQPEAVRQSLERAGLHIHEWRALPDHASAQPELIAHLRSRAAQLGAHYIVCTRKDAVKLHPEHLDPNAKIPLLIISIQLEFLRPGDEQQLLQCALGE